MRSWSVPSTKLALVQPPLKTLYPLSKEVSIDRSRIIKSQISVNVAPDGPPELVQCDPISPTSISISWKAPLVEERNGIILGYLVTYRLENKIGGNPWHTLKLTKYRDLYSAGKDTIHSKKTGGLQATVEGLEIFESYYIKVAAFTKVGTGVRSDKLICTTAPDGNNKQ